MRTVSFVFVSDETDIVDADVESGSESEYDVCCFFFLSSRQLRSSSRSVIFAYLTSGFRTGGGRGCISDLMMCAFRWCVGCLGFGYGWRAVRASGVVSFVGRVRVDRLFPLMCSLTELPDLFV